MADKRESMLHLASSSPRRREILAALGLKFTVASVDVMEEPEAGESAEQMVLRLAIAKAVSANVAPPHIVVGSDTAVVLGKEVLGKPAGQDDAIDMLLKLSGRRHCVLTGVAVIGSQGVQTALSSTDVTFREIGRDEALAYWHSGEPCDKAGAYGIQGRGGAFVAAINGSYSGVMGLPVFETAQLLKAEGIEILLQRKNDGR